MGGKSSSPPPAPDPYTVAGAQTQMNNQNALFNAQLNRYNTVTPFGSQTWSMSGGGAPSGGTGTGIRGGLSSTGSFGLGGGLQVGGRGSGGASNSSGAPSYTQTISLNPMDQQILDQQRQQSLGITGAGNNLVGDIQANSSLSTPDFNKTRQAAQDALYSNQTQYLDPQFSQQQEQLQSQLANQGVVPGTEAYDNAMGNFNRSRNQAYGSAMNSAISGATGQQGQAIQNYSNLTNLPINQLNSLRSGTQVQTPNFQNPASTNAAPSDITSAFNNQYQGQLAAYNAQQQSSNAGLGGLFSLGSSFLGAPGVGSSIVKGLGSIFSDARLKHDANRIGTTPAGIPIYKFKYLGSEKDQIGVMAQDVLEVKPSAVIEDESGYLKVDYRKVS